jgi:hypothetical protein
VDVHSSSSRAGAAAAVTALLLCTSLAAADAANSAQAVSTRMPAASGNWGALATTRTTAPYGTGSLKLTFSGPLPPSQYFTVVNTGTLALAGQIYKATTSGNSVEIQMCSTTWNESNDSCSVTPTTVPSNGSSAFTAALPATGSKIRLRARIIGVQLSSSTVTISVNVTRTQVRAATITGS